MERSGSKGRCLPHSSDERVRYSQDAIWPASTPSCPKNEESAFPALAPVPTVRTVVS